LSTYLSQRPPSASTGSAQTQRERQGQACGAPPEPT
jgi:hypothetical protein